MIKVYSKTLGCFVLSFLGLTSSVMALEVSNSENYRIKQSTFSVTGFVVNFSDTRLANVVNGNAAVGISTVGNKSLLAGYKPHVPWLDSDGDSYTNSDDAFPYDSTEFLDSDNDGIGDNRDAFPFDTLEWIDTDLDGTGNNADLDDDNDGIPDYFELANGFDPLVNDAADDLDGNGISNMEEYLNSIHSVGYQVMRLNNGKVLVLP